MSAERRYQLQDEEANRQVDALLERLRVPGGTWRYQAEMVTTALKMFEDGAQVADLKIANSALKELRYGFKVFAPYRSVPKVTVFGSARTPADHAVSQQARSFGKRMTESGWMVITGAGSGVMGAAQEGAGRERSFGMNIRLPFEQDANPWNADSCLSGCLNATPDVVGGSTAAAARDPHGRSITSTVKPGRSSARWIARAAASPRGVRAERGSRSTSLATGTFRGRAAWRSPPSGSSGG